MISDFEDLSESDNHRSRFDPEKFKYINFAALNIYHYIAAGIFGFNIKSYLKRNKISQDVEEAILFIDKQISGGRISKSEDKIQYRNIIKLVVENVQLDTVTTQKMNALKDIISNNK